MVACSVWNAMELSGQVQHQVAVRLRTSLKEAEVEDPWSFMSELFLIRTRWTLIRKEKWTDEIRHFQGGMALDVAFGNPVSKLGCLAQLWCRGRSLGLTQFDVPCCVDCRRRPATFQTKEESDGGDRNEVGGGNGRRARRKTVLGM